MTRKNRGSQIFCSGAELSETDMSSLRHQAEVNARLGLESELAAESEDAKVTVEYQPQKCKDRGKLRLPFWGELRKVILQQTQTCEDETSEQAR